MYPARTLDGIICGIQRHLEETVGSKVLNPLDASDTKKKPHKGCSFLNASSFMNCDVKIFQKTDENHAWF